jgi:signal transduction histidine kinase
MTKEQLLLAIVLSTLLILLLLGFLLFMLLWQRAKNNRFIIEKELMETRFNEQLFKAQLEIQEQTFDNISMEIHDNVGQTLSLLKVQLNIMEQQGTFDQHLVADIKQNTGKAMADLRDIAKSLSSERIKLATLAELTAHELERLENTGIIATDLQVQGQEQTLTAERKLILFRIVQESLQNIIKHARADKVRISFLYQQGYFTIEISDNGLGFNENLLTEQLPGLGLKNIRQRTKVVGGEATIRSETGSGTTITITVPNE